MSPTFATLFSIFKFNLQLSHSNEWVGTRQAGSVSQSLEIMNQLASFIFAVFTASIFEVIVLAVLLASSSEQFVSGLTFLMKICQSLFEYVGNRCIKVIMPSKPVFRA